MVSGVQSERERVWPYLPLVAVALGLRLWKLGTQVVNGDEVYPLRVAKDHGLGYVLTHFHEQDNSIPVTAWCRILFETTGLDEWGLRSLPVASGVLLCALVPRLTRAFLPAPERWWLAWAVAVSPLFVAWSRLGRPYATVVLLGALLVATWWRACRDGRARTWWSPAACAALTLWFSPTALPFVAALLALSPVVAPRGRRWRSLVPGVLAALATAALLVPALPSLMEVLERKQEGRPVELTTWVQSLQTVVGTSRRPPQDLGNLVLLIPLALGVLGYVELARRRRELALAAALVLVLPAVAWTLAQPLFIDRARVFVRYQAAALPILGALVAYGLARLRGSLGHPWPTWAASLLLAVQVARGPVLETFTTAAPMGPLYTSLFLRNPVRDFEPDEVPGFYRDVAGEPGLVVLEWPALQTSLELLRTYQRVHGGAWVRAEPAEGHPPALRTRTLQFGLEGVRDRLPRGAYVVLHRRIEEESNRVRGRDLPVRHPWPSENQWAQALARCERELGAPIHVDSDLTVFRVPDVMEGRHP